MLKASKQLEARVSGAEDVHQTANMHYAVDPSHAHVTS